MSVPPNILEAKKWCDEARKLVNQRKKKGDVLKLARDQVTTAVESMVSQLGTLRALNVTKAEEFDKKFVTASQKAKGTGGKGGDDKGFIEAGTALNTLATEIQQAIEFEQALAKEKKAFTDEYNKLYIEVAEASGLRGMEDPESPVSKAWEIVKKKLIDTKNGVDNTVDKTVVTQQKALLTDIRKELKGVAEKSANQDKAVEEQLKAMKAWKDLEPKLRSALKELSEKPGAQTERSVLQKMYSDALKCIVPAGPSTTGHAQALIEARGYEAQLKTGREKITAYTNQNLPQEVISAKTAMDETLKKYALLVPPYVYQIDADERDRLGNLGKQNVSEAVEKLGALKTSLDREVERLTKEKTAAENARDLYATALKALQDIQQPASVPVNLYAELMGKGARALTDLETGARRWTIAQQTFTSLTPQLTQLAKDYPTVGKAWSDAQETLETYRKQAIGYLKFLPAAKLALACLDTLTKLQDGFSTQDMATALDGYRKAEPALKKQIEDLKALLPKVSDKDTTPLSDRIDNHIKELNEWGGTLFNTLATCNGDIRSHLDKQQNAKVKKGAPPALSFEERQTLQDHYFKRIDGVWDKWITYRNTQADAPNGVKAESAEREKEAQSVVKELLGLTTSSALKNKATEIGKLPPTVPIASELKAFLLNPPPGMADEIKRISSLSTPLTEEETLKQLKSFHVQLRVDLGKKRTDLLNLVKTEINAPIKDLKISETYRKELKESSRDIERMTDTDDPDLLAVAEGMKERLKKQLEAIKNSPTLYEGNKKKLELLIKRVGNLIPELPDTHARMFSAWEEEIVRSKHTDPIEMQGHVNEFELQVKAAEALLEKRVAAVKIYRENKTKARELWALVKKVGNAPALGPWFDARLADAHQSRMQEGGTPAAERILLEVRNALQKVLDSKPPTLALADLNAKQVLAQRQVLDLAKTFERELKIFYSTTLAGAKTAIKQSKSKDKSSINGLESMGKAAEKIVEPYLKNLSLLKIGAAPAPDSIKVQTDFDRAHQLLRDASATAQRLVGNPQSTNVDGPDLGPKVREGLANLQRKWFERVRALDNALVNASDAIKTMFDNPSDPTLKEYAENTLANEKQDVKQFAAVAAQKVDDLRSLLRTNAFAESFNVLMDNAATTKEEKKSLKAKQLIAREEALKVMRLCRNQLHHPLLKTLTQPAKNPFGATALLVAVSGVNTALKEIELQALASA